MWKSSRWNPAAGKAEGSHQDSKNLNAYLETLYFKALQAKKHLIDTDNEISSESIKNFLLGIGEKKRLILEIFQDHNDQVKALIGKDYTAATLQRYHTTMAHTLSFIQWKYGKENMDIQLLDYDFISSFSFYLKSIKNCNHNTTLKYLTNFKKIVLICVKNGWLIRNPFTQFRMVKKEVNRIILTWQEMQKISEKTFVTDRLNHVRDIFLFSCFTGLA